MSKEPRDGEIRAVNYTTSAVEDGQPIINHRLEQYYSGEWREIRVYDEHEDKDGNLSVREIDRLRAKKKQIYEDLKDAVDREWVGLKWFLFEENGEEYFFPASTDAEALESAKKRGATLVREATKCEYTCEGNREWVGLTKKEIESISERVKPDPLMTEEPTWHIRFAQALQRKLMEKNT